MGTSIPGWRAGIWGSRRVFIRDFSLGLRVLCVGGLGFNGLGFGLQSQRPAAVQGLRRTVSGPGFQVAPREPDAP